MAPTQGYIPESGVVKPSRPVSEEAVKALEQAAKKALEAAAQKLVEKK